MTDYNATEDAKRIIKERGFSKEIYVKRTRSGLALYDKVNRKCFMVDYPARIVQWLKEIKLSRAPDIQ